ncbi:LPXTG cell wall anchor domain-containing protein, partial [Bacillus sp. MHSD17]|nr:LPXTG cell wall anchor domain-containing protein [Bacillus sp. MHSD17]
EVHTIQKVIVKDKDTSKAKSITNNGNIPNNSNSDKKETTYKELPNTGTSTTNSATMGLWMVIAGTVLTLVRKFRKIQK